MKTNIEAYGKMEERKVPVISMFAGMKISMNFIEREHNPPHIHVVSGEHSCMIDIRTGEFVEGNLPKKKKEIIKEWVSLHQEELLFIWNSQEFIRIEPYK